MELTALILIPLLAGAVAWWAERLGSSWPRWIAMAAMTADLLLAATFWPESFPSLGAENSAGPWLLESAAPWIPSFGISWHLALDGLSLLLVLLTAVLGLAAIVASWSEITERVGFFHFNVLWVLAGVMGVFTAMDLFLFFVWWEVMLVPMYLLINIWGHEHRTAAAVKFFLFTQAGSLLMLLSILGLAFLHAAQTGRWSFDYFSLMDVALSPRMELALMLGFFVAFAVKLPMVPFHPWLPDAHTEAPTGGSVLLAGLLLKTGGYGLLRFTVPLFPDAALAFAPVAMALGAAGIVYGAVLAFAQTDAKRLVAYSSISHLGFVLLGIFAWNTWAVHGAVVQMLAHGLSTGALFMLVGALQERLHTRDMGRMGGLWDRAPRLAALTLAFAVASLGLPGLGNFVGEFLVLVGSYQIAPIVTSVAALGIIGAAIYSLWLIHRVFYGEAGSTAPIADLAPRSVAALGACLALLLWIGLYPQALMPAIGSALEPFQSDTTATERGSVATVMAR